MSLKCRAISLQCSQPYVSSMQNDASQLQTFVPVVQTGVSVMQPDVSSMQYSRLSVNIRFNVTNIDQFEDCFSGVIFKTVNMYLIIGISFLLIDL